MGVQLWTDGEFDGKLYQPYNKKEKIGKVCDFVTAAFMNVAVRPQQKAAPTATQEIFDEEDKGFEMVEDGANLVNKKKTKTPYQQNNYNFRGRGGYRGGRGAPMMGGRGGAKPWQNNRYQQQVGADASAYLLGKKGFRDQSIEVRGDWPVIVEFSKNQLEKLNPVTPTLVVSDSMRCGDVFKYDGDLDKSRTYKPTPLLKVEPEPEVYYTKTTLEDKVIR